MPLPRRGWVGWIEEHSRLLGAIAVWLFIVTGGIGALVASATGGKNTGELSTTSPAPTTSGTIPSGIPTSGALPSNGVTAGPGNKKGGGNNGNTNAPSTGPSSNPSSQPTTPVSPPPDQPVPPTKNCKPTQPKAADGGPETGITNGSVTIGEIISDVSQLPQQFRPTWEGLSAWANLVNKSGGICGRRIDIVERNDQVVNFRQEYQSLSNQVFAFVSAESLQDGNEYQSGPPYMPQDKDSSTGEYVPDVGGLALAYPRAQSPMHAGIFGSLSPVLIGGGAYHYMTSAAPGNQCKKGGVIYLQEPTGASKDQADIGQIALNASWGGGLPSQEYSQQLGAQEPQWETTVQQMISDGVNCAFTYADAQSNVNLLKAMVNQGVWPPQSCTDARKAADQCFHLVYMPFTAVDQSFVANAPAGAQVTSYMPHVPLNETSNAAVRTYLSALSACNRDRAFGCDGNAQPSTFSVIGFASGVMFGQALAACGSAPTRGCVMTYLHDLKNFTAGGLVAPITPFECTKVRYNGSTWCYKHIFYRYVVIRELGQPSQGLNAFRRIYPSTGFAEDALHVVRGQAV